MPSSALLDRRSLLHRGLVSLPLLRGGVTLIGPSIVETVPLADVAVAHLTADPRERARHVWYAFTKAMRNVTAGSDAWRVMGGEQVRPVGYIPVREP